jgi:hypothetical protein
VIDSGPRDQNGELDMLEALEPLNIFGLDRPSGDQHWIGKTRPKQQYCYSGENLD